MKTNDDTLNKLCKCIILFGAIATLVGLAFWIAGVIKLKQVGFYELGLVLGTIMSLLWAKDIYDTLDKGLEKDQESASKYMKKRSIIRMLIIIVIIILGGYLSLNMIVGTMVGLISLKISAYVQVLINKQR